MYLNNAMIITVQVTEINDNIIFRNKRSNFRKFDQNTRLQAKSYTDLDKYLLQETAAPTTYTENRECQITTRTLLEI